MRQDVGFMAHNLYHNGGVLVDVDNQFTVMSASWTCCASKKHSSKKHPECCLQCVWHANSWLGLLAVVAWQSESSADGDLHAGFSVVGHA
jgi:heat shock protein HspQ